MAHNAVTMAFINGLAESPDDCAQARRVVGARQDLFVAGQAVRMWADANELFWPQGVSTVTRDLFLAGWRQIDWQYVAESLQKSAKAA